MANPEALSAGVPLGTQVDGKREDIEDPKEKFRRASRTLRGKHARRPRNLGS